MVNSCMVILPSRSMSARFLNNTTKNKTTVTESNSKQIKGTLYKQVICNPKRLKLCPHRKPNKAHFHLHVYEGNASTFSNNREIGVWTVNM